jgi:hypothetical protein
VTFELVQVPARNSVVALQVNQITSVTQAQTFVATGFTTGFTSTITVQFISVSTSDFQITSYSPLDITVAGVPIENTVYLLQLESPNPVEALLFLTNGISNVLATDIDLGRPIIVKLGGSVLPSYLYSVDDLSPVTITFDIAPPQGIEISISVSYAITWYQPGVNTASDGIPLQETDTQAARFIRGEI